MLTRGQLVKVVGLLTKDRASLIGGQRCAPFFRDFRDMDPAGLVDNGTFVIVIDAQGPHFAQCMSSKGVVWFRKEHLSPIHPEM